MNTVLMSLISIIAGVGITLQSAMSGQLSGILKNPLWAVFALYLVSSVFVLLILWVSSSEVPNPSLIFQVPKHLWFAGSLLSVVALSLVYWQMPQIGVAKVISGVLVGQVLMSMLASHYGWFGLPLIPVDFPKLMGAASLVVGVILINGEFINGTIE